MRDLFVLLYVLRNNRGFSVSRLMVAFEAKISIDQTAASEGTATSVPTAVFWTSKGGGGGWWGGWGGVISVDFDCLKTAAGAGWKMSSVLVWKRKKWREGWEKKEKRSRKHPSDSSKWERTDRGWRLTWRPERCWHNNPYRKGQQHLPETSIYWS